MVSWLNKEQLQGVVTIIDGTQGVQKRKEEMTFDLGEIPVRKQRELEAYVKKCLDTNRNNKNKRKKG